MILMDFSYFFLLFFGFLAGVWDAVWGISAVSATFSCSFLAFWAGFGVLFWGFLRFQLLFPALFQLFGRGWDAVWGISAVSATFSCSFQAFWLGLGCCFRNFRNYSSTRPAYYATNLWLLYLMII